MLHLPKRPVEKENMLPVKIAAPWLKNGRDRRL
jgi:hypothetical protein